MKLMSIFVACAAILSMGTATAHHPAKGDAEHSDANAGASKAQGEVKNVDKEAGKITIQHGPIANLGMPAMTMVFRVNEPAMLEAVNAGDKIYFIVQKAGGAIVVTKVEAAK